MNSSCIAAIQFWIVLVHALRGSTLGSKSRTSRVLKAKCFFPFKIYRENDGCYPYFNSGIMLEHLCKPFVLLEIIGEHVCTLPWILVLISESSDKATFFFFFFYKFGCPESWLIQTRKRGGVWMCVLFWLWFSDWGKLQK